MNTTTIAPEFRKRALKKVTLGILGCAGMVGLFLAIARAGYVPANPFMLIPAAVPFVYFCMCMIELLTGRPYQQLAGAWMALKGWQRGVIGLLIVLAAVFLIGVVVTGIVMWLT